MKIEIPITPMPSPRPRMTKYGGVYMPKGYQEFKELLKQYYPFEIHFKGPVRVDCTFYFPVPKSWTKKKKAEHIGQYHTQKPDRDNLDKTILDSMTEVFFDDDCQVCSGTIEKYWAETGKIVIEIQEATR